MNNKVRILLLLMLTFGACEEGYVTKCGECMPDGIGDVRLKIYVSQIVNSAVNVIKIYEGPIEDGILLAELTVYGDYTEFTGMLYKDYTVSVEYTVNGKRYIAIDGARPKVRFDEDSCDEPCYYVYDNVVDLRLEYTR